VKLAQLDRPHDRQYIALHKKGNNYFAMHPHKPNFQNPRDLPLICFNFL
jgi:hypothetical protein